MRNINTTATLVTLEKNRLTATDMKFATHLAAAPRANLVIARRSMCLIQPYIPSYPKKSLFLRGTAISRTSDSLVLSSRKILPPWMPLSYIYVECRIKTVYIFIDIQDNDESYATAILLGM